MFGLEHNILLLDILSLVYVVPFCSARYNSPTVYSYLDAYELVAAILPCGDCIHVVLIVFPSPLYPYNTTSV